MALAEKATHQQTRAHNQQLVLRTIYEGGSPSRADVARLTGLTRTSVSDLVSDLLMTGLVAEAGRGPSSGGKAPILLRVVPDARLLIGLDLAEAAFSGAVVNLRGGIVRAVSLPLEGRDGQAAVDLVFQLIDELASGVTQPLLGIGIGAPGVVDSERGVVRWAVNLGWADVELGRLVRERYRLPVAIANDSQAAALAEHTLGSGEIFEDLVVIRVGRGIGAGVILSGQLYQGDGFGAGEIGHTTMIDGGDLCRCGRRGCLETVASMRALVEQAGAAGDAELVAAFHAGDEPARSAVLAGARALGLAIGGLIGALSVRRFALIGSALAFGPDWLQEIRKTAQRSALPLLSDHVVVDFGEVHDDVVVLGASALLMSNELGLNVSP